MRAKISKFSNIVFGKANISKVKFSVFLFCFVFFARKKLNLRLKLGFLRCFCLFSAGS